MPGVVGGPWVCGEEEARFVYSEYVLFGDERRGV
jgi:hypothetical protein